MKWLILALFLSGCGGVGENVVIVNPFIDSFAGVDFDGTGSYVYHTGPLTGAADSKKGIFSGWVRIDNAGVSSKEILSLYPPAGALPGSLFRFEILLSGGKFAIASANLTAGSIFTLQTVSSYSAGATWLHILASWDTGNNLKHLYVSDVSDLSAPLFTNNALDYTSTNLTWRVGSAVNSAFFDGCIAELYFNAAEYMDLSVEANRRKFISAGGKPVSLGPNGAAPTGNTPAIYLGIGAGQASDFAINKGSGGNFTIQPPLPLSSTNPSD